MPRDIRLREAMDGHVRPAEWAEVDREERLEKLEREYAGMVLPQVRIRAVRCVETGAIFDSLRDAATSVGLSASNIKIAADNGTVSGGFHWEYRK